MALSGKRPTLNSQVEIVEAPFTRDDHQCLLAQAVDAHEPLVIDDLADERRSNDTLLTKLNARSALVCPIRYASHQYGAIGVLSHNPKRAASEDVLFLQSLSLLLGPTIAYQRTEAVLAQHSEVFNATIDSLDSMVLVLSPDGKIIRVNQACEEFTGFKPEDLKHRHFWGAFLLPEDVSIAQDAFGKLRLGQSPVKCEMFLLTLPGERRRVAWSFTHLPQIEDGSSSYVASGIDITEQHDALESLERFEASGLNGLSHKGDGESNDGQAIEDPPPIPKNRRRSRRRDFLCSQLIGPMYDGRLPHADEYQQVGCRDISPSGFSFFTRTPPDYRELVVAFGAYPSQLYLTAKVIHVNRHQENGQDLMVVGCQYMSRVDL